MLSYSGFFPIRNNQYTIVQRTDRNTSNRQANHDDHQQRSLDYFLSLLLLILQYYNEMIRRLFILLLILDD